jgi:hypothetical protein
MSIRLCSVRIFLLCLLLAPYQRVSAQADGGARLSRPNTEQFPLIQAYLDVHDTQGNFIHKLEAEQVKILEDGTVRPVTKLEELLLGVQVVVAINPGPSFAIRNNKAISRYDILKEGLRNWAKSRLGSNVDDLSLLIANGPAASHTPSSVRTWIFSFAPSDWSPIHYPAQA